MTLPRRSLTSVLLAALIATIALAFGRRARRRRPRSTHNAQHGK